MDAAEQQVRQKGADGFSYSDLSTAVGLRKASIHYHFPAKSDLLTAIMARYGKRVMLELETYGDRFDTAEQQLEGFVAFYSAALQQGSSLCLCVAYAVNADGLSANTRQEIARFRAEVLTWLQHRFEMMQTRPDLPGGFGNATDAAAATLALVEGAQLSARIAADPAIYDQATRRFREQLRRQ